MAVAVQALDARLHWHTLEAWHVVLLESLEPRVFPGLALGPLVLVFQHYLEELLVCEAGLQLGPRGGQVRQGVLEVLLQLGRQQLLGAVRAVRMGVADHGPEARVQQRVRGCQRGLQRRQRTTRNGHTNEPRGTPAQHAVPRLPRRRGQGLGGETRHREAVGLRPTDDRGRMPCACDTGVPSAKRRAWRWQHHQKPRDVLLEVGRDESNWWLGTWRPWLQGKLGYEVATRCCLRQVDFVKVHGGLHHRARLLLQQLRGGLFGGSTAAATAAYPSKTPQHACSGGKGRRPS
mmetsp:Transcript_41104/g.106307  ORF Transcript_41104/g.106307 Transcript_41104/m.106307 type:complete len:290 (-) Transcript_41104:10-879(-)